MPTHFRKREMHQTIMLEIKIQRTSQTL